MSKAELLKEIDKMPLHEKLSLLGRAIKDIIKHSNENEVILAADSLEHEYKTNSELTIFQPLTSKISMRQNEIWLINLPSKVLYIS